MAEKYKIKKISEITKNDKKVVLIGKAVDVNKNSFLLDDGSGKEEIFFVGEIEKNNFVRVFCSIGEKLRADIVQVIEENDFYLFRDFNELYRKVEDYV